MKDTKVTDEEIDKVITNALIKYPDYIKEGDGGYYIGVPKMMLWTGRHGAYDCVKVLEAKLSEN
jgi:hypothetical protein